LQDGEEVPVLGFHFVVEVEPRGCAYVCAAVRRRQAGGPVAARRSRTPRRRRPGLWRSPLR
jgi:hypothetical protein